MIAWLRHVLGHGRELATDSPLHRSRRLTAEANERVARSEHLIERIQRGESGIWLRDMIDGVYRPEGERYDPS